ncbi:hypothetical protein FQN57_004078 [Myotisia sp. PD_48]|nr:hypothetical protein FQN57_004078 [Myotisia sp. PD_48]
MSAFILPGSNPPVSIHLPPDLSQAQFLSFPALKIWLSTLQHSLARQQNTSHPFNLAPYTLRSIDVQAVDFFGSNRLGFVKLKADVSADDGQKLPGAVFLRGGSVGILLIIQPDDLPQGSDGEKQVILTVQPRIPAGSLAFIELPAGMIDDAGSFAGAAANEIQEETGLTIRADELIDMSALTLLAQNDASADHTGVVEEEKERLENAVYPSPGGCDEFIPLFLCQKRMARTEISQLEGRLTGLRNEGEMITLKLVPLDNLWKEAARDGKALAAWALYQGLRKEERI